MQRSRSPATRASPAPEEQKKSKNKVEDFLHRPGLVGSIVEKGFSSDSDLTPPRPPQPSVLAFPVARHRSQGPHWAPVRTGAEVEEEGADDEDATNYDPISDFAKPPRRKERKGLDFSRWRELLSEETTKGKDLDRKKVKPEVERTGDVWKGEKMGAEVGKVSDGDKEGFVRRKKGDDFDPPRRFPAVEQAGAIVGDGEGDVGVGKDGGLDSSLLLSRDDGDGRMEVDEVGAPSMVDEIDAENRARIGQMSQGEIAEAKVEIMERMGPAVSKMLKKRGRDKMEVGRRKAGASGKDIVNKVGRGGTQVKDLKFKGPQQGESVKVSSSGESLVAASDSSAWRAWSERVQKVRGLRFSLDGNAIATSSSEGHMDACNQYTPENVTERDYLRTEGDPGAAGYTIKEAAALVRSMVPAQRSLALHLLASVLEKARSNLQWWKTRCGPPTNTDVDDVSVDWQAVWAYALGPEPEIGLILRIALDDNHNSVVLACAKVIQCLLCCDLNEAIFNLLEKSSIHEKGTCTAPIFRSRPEIACGFLRGGFWKYSAKPSNIVPVWKGDDGEEGEGDDENPTIRDDVVVAEQDLAAGLVRMGILPRICYLLEMDPSPPLDESLMSILVALARHSPTCSRAVVKCPRLVQTILDRFAKLTSWENLPYQIKTILLLKVLSEADKRHCLDFIDRGIFQRTMLQLYRNALSLDDSLHSGKEEQIKITSALMIQQLQFWKVCIRYGYCLSYFADFFPAMCFWMSPPTFSTLVRNNGLGEFTAVATESFIVLEVLSRRLPCIPSVERSEKLVPSDDGEEIWSWNFVVPMIELALKWLVLPTTLDLKSVGGQKKMADSEEHTSSVHIFWVISAAMRMLSSIIDRISSSKAVSDVSNSRMLPWLPEFVPKIGLSIVKSGFLNFVDSSNLCLGGQHAVDSSSVEYLCQLRDCSDGGEASLASTCCLRGLIELINSMDKLIQRTKCSDGPQPSGEDNILFDGIAKCAHGDLVKVLDKFINLVGSGYQSVQSVETFGRGGPAPGVGIGWGSSGGGFLSLNVLQAQVDSCLVQSLYEILPVITENDVSIPVVVSDCPVDAIFPILQKINSIVGMCLVAGPSGKSVVERALKTLLQVPVFRSLATCIRHLRQSDKRIKPVSLQFSDEDYMLLSKALGSHFHSRWLTAKKKSSAGNVDESNLHESPPGRRKQLETIPEDVEASSSEAFDVCKEGNSLQIEWAHQRLPLPVHWFLSPLCTVSDPEAYRALCGSSDVKIKCACSSDDPDRVVKGGLLFLLVLETMACHLSTRSIHSPILQVPLVWKLHALSMMLIIKLDALEDARFREIFETLQVLYGQQLRESVRKGMKPNDKSLASSYQYFEAGDRRQALDFEKEIHESYNTFIETFVEHFASVSYGDIAFGRQVAVYLHRSIDSTLRLLAWNAMSNAHVLELMPPLGDCICEAGGYLEPMEEDEAILEAYAKSWTSGALDKAARQGSMSFALAMHHLSCFIFDDECAPEKLRARNRLGKSLLRGLSRKPNQQDMIMDLIKYDGSLSKDLHTTDKFRSEGEPSRRLAILSEACEGNASLLVELEKIKSSLTI